MAETAKILNPGKRVVLPDLDAGCSLADRCPADAFAAWLKDYPDHVVVSYINCSAGVKALSDIICTSSNAEKVVRSIPADRKIVFAPDRHLGRWVMARTGRDMVLWPGFCIVHEQFTARRVAQLKAAHPGGPGHRPPGMRREREPDGRLRRLHRRPAQLRGHASPAKSFIVGTEAGHPAPDAQAAARTPS